MIYNMLSQAIARNLAETGVEERQPPRREVKFYAVARGKKQAALTTIVEGAGVIERENDLTI